MLYTTIDQALARVRTVKPVQKRQFRRYMDALNIQPIGARTRPRMYPFDLADRVLAHIGLNGNGATLPSMETLKKTKKGTRK